MRHANWLAGTVTALALAFVAAPGQAAPVGTLAGDVKAAADARTSTEQVRHRCYWHRGHLHCPRHRYYHHYNPGIQFNFGSRRHYHHRHHRHHWHR